MAHRHKRNRRHISRRQHDRGVPAVMVLLAPVLAKTVASTLASQAIEGIGKSVTSARDCGRPRPRWYK